MSSTTTAAPTRTAKSTTKSATKPRKTDAAKTPVESGPTDSIETTKIHINGMFHLLDPITNDVYTFDPADVVHVCVGKLNDAGELVYRSDWREAVLAAAAKQIA